MQVMNRQDEAAQTQEKRKILILDDDTQFGGLLSTVFKKGDYEITPCSSPDQALEILAKYEFDVLVTDYKMPGMSGIEITQKVFEEYPNMIIFMVSAYLDSTIVRELINLGVHGVFIKPLNIFALLERTKKILKERQVKSNSSTHIPALGDSTEEVSTPESSLKAFPCLDKRSIRLAKDIKEKANFDGTLVFIGKHGSPYFELIEDLIVMSAQQPQYLMTIDETMVTEEAFLQHVQKKFPLEEKKTVNIQLVDLFLLQSAKDFFTQLLSGMFDRDLIEFRMILCLNKSPDYLLENNIIDDEIYLLLGNNEVDIPQLSDCPHDIMALCRMFIKQSCEEFKIDTIPNIDDSARRYLYRHCLFDNYLGVSRLINRIIKKNSYQEGVITDHDLINNTLLMVDERSRLIKEMLDLRKSMINALLMLLDNDVENACSLLGIEILFLIGVLGEE